MSAATRVVSNLGYLVHGYAVNLLTCIIIHSTCTPRTVFRHWRGGEGRVRPRGSATGPTQDTGGERGDAWPQQGRILQILTHSCNNRWQLRFCETRKISREAWYALSLSLGYLHNEEGSLMPSPPPPPVVPQIPPPLTHPPSIPEGSSLLGFGWWPSLHTWVGRGGQGRGGGGVKPKVSPRWKYAGIKTWESVTRKMKVFKIQTSRRLSPNLWTFKEPRNRFHEIDSASLWSLADPYVK